MTADYEAARVEARGAGHGGSLVWRVAALLVGLAVCLCGGWYSAREGLAQFFAGYGLMSEELTEADRAVRLNTATPEAHYARASLLYDSGELRQSIAEYEEATRLRPRDYALWFELGRAREQAGDVAGALKAFQESVRLAPFYARPRWQLGNTLFRAGRRDEAFAELQRAASSDPRLTPQLLDLAGAAYGDDARAVVSVVRPQTPGAHLALARFFFKRRMMREGLDQFHAAGEAVTAEERRGMVTDLLAAHRFDEAYEVWSGGHSASAAKASAAAGTAFINGGFEEDVSLDEPGFGWQLPAGKAQGFEAAQDSAAPRAGSRSLRLTWNGNNAVQTPILSQLVLVQPGARYQLRFAARTEKLVTGGLPEVFVSDAGSGDERALGRPVVLPQGTSDWQDYVVEFATGNETRAVLVGLSRQSCGSAACPAFGRVWLDQFSLSRIGVEAP